PHAGAMHRERAQGTVEYVGVLLMVGLLLAAIAALVGVPASTTSIATSFVHALSSALGADAPARSATPQPSEQDAARFARATDAGVAPDDRPSLRDVRLELIAEHGDARGRLIYRALVVAQLQRVVPGLDRPTRFGTIDHDPLPRGFARADALILRLHALGPPADGDPGEIETARGEPDVHVVTQREEDDAFRQAVHPGTSWRSLALDVVGAVPGVGTVRGVARVSLAAAKGLATVVSVLDDAENAIAGLSPGADEIPPGSRAGDEIATWTATRRASPRGPATLVRRTAVVRDGGVLAAGIDVLPERTP
ncbi:MAG: hypothetical protein ABI317_06535, partial [Gaiellales bacterium]